MAAGGSLIKDSTFYKKVINKCRRQLIADLEPLPLLDVFLEEEYVTDIQERDIRELASTSDKNREILSKVSSKGVKGFNDFKMCLEKSSQKHLVEYIESTETKLEEEALAFHKVSNVNNQTGFKCSVCDLSYDTVKLLEEHTQTSEHMNMIKELQEFAKENQEEIKDDEEEPGDFTSLSYRLSLNEQNSLDASKQASQCYLCDINFTSPSHASSHFSGKPHKKKKALFDMKHPQPTPEPMKEGSFQQYQGSFDQPDSCTMLTQATLQSSNDTVSVQQGNSGLNLTCGICQVSFSGESNAKEHYASERHKKKENLLKKQTLGEALPLSCDICVCNFTGPESAEAHFNSERHKKKANKVNPESTELQKQKIGGSLPLSCDICICNFTGPENAEAHFNSEKHKKKANKVKSENTELEHQKFAGSLPLSCDICVCNFTGPESAEAHFTSEKHKKKANKVKVESTEALPLSCDICHSKFTSEENAKQHYEGKKHRKNVAQHKSGDAITQNMDTMSFRSKSDEFDTNSIENNAHSAGLTKDALEDVEDEMSANLENLSLSEK